MPFPRQRTCNRVGFTDPVDAMRACANKRLLTGPHLLHSLAPRPLNQKNLNLARVLIHLLYTSSCTSM